MTSHSGRNGRPHPAKEPQSQNETRWSPGPSLSCLNLCAHSFRGGYPISACISSLGMSHMQGGPRARSPPTLVTPGSRDLLPPLRPTVHLCQEKGRQKEVTRPSYSSNLRQIWEEKAALLFPGIGSSRFTLSNLFTKERNQRSCVSSNLLLDVGGFPGGTEGTWEAGGGARLRDRRCQGNVTRGSSFA